MAANLYKALTKGCPSELLALFAPVYVAIADDTVLQPDLLVVRRDEYADDTQPLRPLLAVGILSPSTRHVDLSLERVRYQTAGCPSYWVIDPDEPSITVWELEGRVPYAVSLNPTRLRN